MKNEIERAEPSRGAPQQSWAIQIWLEIHRLTPDIKGKAFNPDWVLLSRRFEQFEAGHVVLLEACKGLLEELRLIRMKDTNAVYDPTIRVRAEAAGGAGGAGTMSKPSDELLRRAREHSEETGNGLPPAKAATKWRNHPWTAEDIVRTADEIVMDKAQFAEQIVRECARIAMEASWSHGNEVKHEILITFGLKE